LRGKAPEILTNRRKLKDTPMSRRCELTGKGTQVGNNVSHANNKTKRIYRPNLQIIALASELLGNSYKLKISMNALRSVDRNGGLDPFILKCRDSVLSPKALRLKRAIAKKASEKEAA
jgi:large subunit ribosomal protein L28